MNLRALLGVCLIVICFTVLPQVCKSQEENAAANRDNNKLFFSVTKEKSSPNNILIGLNFMNISDLPIRLFGDSKVLDEGAHIFFSISAVFDDGQTFSTPMGTWDMKSEDLTKYILIKKGKTYKKIIDLKKIFTSFNITLPEDSFDLKISYHNQYGPDDCIKGTFDAAQIEIAERQ